MDGVVEDVEVASGAVSDRLPRAGEVGFVLADCFFGDFDVNSNASSPSDMGSAAFWGAEFTGSLFDLGDEAGTSGSRDFFFFGERSFDMREGASCRRTCSSGADWFGCASVLAGVLAVGVEAGFAF